MQVFGIISAIMAVIMSAKPTKMEVECEYDFRWAKTTPNCFFRCKKTGVLVFVCPLHNVTLSAFDFILWNCFWFLRLLINEIVLIYVLLRHWPLHWRRKWLILDYLLLRNLLRNLRLFLFVHLLLDLAIRKFFKNLIFIKILLFFIYLILYLIWLLYLILSLIIWILGYFLLLNFR